MMQNVSHGYRGRPTRDMGRDKKRQERERKKKERETGKIVIIKQYQYVHLHDERSARGAEGGSRGLTVYARHRPAENRWPTCSTGRPNPKLRADRPLVALLIHQIGSMNILIASL